MNNSPYRPQPYMPSNSRVDNTMLASTGCGRRTSTLTWGFVVSSTIHTPYYDYYLSFKTTEERVEGTTCAYPS